MIVILFILLFSLNCFSQNENDCEKVDMNYSGYCFEFYPNGKTKCVKEFEYGEKTGIWMFFDIKGNLSKQIDNRHLNKLETKESLTCYGGKAEEETTEELDSNYIFSFVEEDAKFNGDLNAYIVKKLVYPACLMDMDVSGRIYIKFVVEINGAISNVSLIKGIPDCPQCDKEALRVVKSMPPWKPAKNKGRTVRSWCQIPINFTLH